MATTDDLEHLARFDIGSEMSGLQIIAYNLSIKAIAASRVSIA